MQQPVRQTEIPVLMDSQVYGRQTGKGKGFSSKQESVGVLGSFSWEDVNTCLRTLHRAPTMDQRLLAPSLSLVCGDNDYWGYSSGARCLRQLHHEKVRFSLGQMTHTRDLSSSLCYLQLSCEFLDLS